MNISSAYMTSTELSSKLFIGYINCRTLEYFYWPTVTATVIRMYDFDGPIRKSCLVHVNAFKKENVFFLLHKGNTCRGQKYDRKQLL